MYIEQLDFRMNNYFHPKANVLYEGLPKNKMIFYRLYYVCLVNVFLDQMHTKEMLWSSNLTTKLSFEQI